MKKFFALVIFISMLSLSVAGLSIDSPASVAKDSSFGFTVNLDYGYQFARVKVNDALVVEVNANGSVTTGAFNGTFSYNQASNKIFVSVFRAGDDKITLLAETNSDSKSSEVSVYAPISSSEIEQPLNLVHHKSPFNTSFLSKFFLYSSTNPCS